MDEQTWTSSYTTEEFYLLGNLLSIHNFIGMEDPFFGMLSEDIAKSLEFALHTLSERDVLSLESDGSISLNSDVASLIIIMAKAKFSLAARLTDEDKTDHLRFIHFSKDVLIEQGYSINNQLSLTAVKDRDTVKQRLYQFLDLRGSPETNRSGTAISVVDLALARDLVSQANLESIRLPIEKAGGLNETAAKLPMALADGFKTSSVVVTRREGPAIKYGQSLAWMAGSQGLWELIPDESNSKLQLIPRSSAEIKDRLSGIYKEIASAIE